MAKGKGKRKVGAGDVASNRYASYRYELIERIEAGIVLEGTEVKALRTSGAQLKDGYASLRDGELWLHSVHIPPYGPASRENHDPERPRKLLMHRRELDRLATRVNERGLTLVPPESISTARMPRSRSRSRAARTSTTSARRSASARPSATWNGQYAKRGAERRQRWARKTMLRSTWVLRM